MSNPVSPSPTQLYIGIDGGGTSCRARIEDAAGNVLGQGTAGPATTRIGVNRSMQAVCAASEAAAIDASLTSRMVQWLSPEVVHFPSPPEADAVAGALLLARRKGSVPIDSSGQRKGAHMLTEHISPRFVDLNSWSTSDMIGAMYDGQLAACAAVRPALPAINAAVEAAVLNLKRGGRLVYVGAGTSGRIAIQDGAELGPTYDWPSDRIVFVMAGGLQAVLESVEGAEDDEAKGAEAIANAELNENDVVIAVAASGTTPFTIGALRSAGARGALCIAVANNRGAPLFEPAHHRILIETGTEVLAGSTRMQAGTAQKIVLNLFSTAVMVKLGRVYRGLMVSMRASNAKLLRRAEVIVSQIVGCAENDAAKFVERADGDVKIAVLLGLGWEQTEAVEALFKHEGNLRAVIDEDSHDRR